MTIMQIGSGPETQLTPAPDPRPHPTHGPIHRRHVLYPDTYAWYVLASALDVMVTVAVLVHLGAREVNTFAQWTIEEFGTWGLIGLKFISVVIVVAICEHIGRQRQRLGRTLAVAAIFASLLPVTAALTQVAYLTTTGRLVIQEWPQKYDEFGPFPRSRPRDDAPPQSAPVSTSEPLESEKAVAD
jgi:hypothetical protein